MEQLNRNQSIYPNDNHEAPMCNMLDQWILKALSELTLKQMEEFLYRVSQQESLRPGSFDLCLNLQSTSQA